MEIQDLTKTYGATTAVAGVSLAVDEGETYGYLGPNGAGKTTTIRCLLGLLRPSSGTLRIAGIDVADRLGEALTRIGYMPGEFGLWPQMTGRECLEYLGSLHPSPPRLRDELCERFELSKADLDKQVRSYSRGMKQKIAIVQAFQHGPRVLVMDEPTEGLDPVMKERFMALLREHAAGGGTAFISSHILSEVEECADRVAVLRAGKIVREARTEELASARIRHCTVTFEQEAAVAELETLAGTSNLAYDGRSVRFDYTGDMKTLVSRLAALPVKDLLVEPETLLEAFFEVYEGAG